MMKWLVVAAVVLGATRVASAGAWYYTWSCSGNCAPGQLAITGREGPWATKDECESVRWSDYRREAFVGPGNLGGLDFCRDADDPSSGSSSSGGPHGPIPMQRFALGVIGGQGWHVNDSTGMHAPEGRTVGADINLVVGARPNFGLELSFGLQRITVSSPVYGADPQRTMGIVPIYFGFTSSPRIARGRALETRLDLGADFGFSFRTGCTACDADGLTSGGFAAMLRTGLDFYFGRSKGGGLGFDAVFTWGRYGNVADEIAPTPIELVPPQVMFRVALLVRNGNLYW